MSFLLTPGTFEIFFFCRQLFCLYVTGLVGGDIISVMRQIQSANRRMQHVQFSQVNSEGCAAITELSEILHLLEVLIK